MGDLLVVLTAYLWQPGFGLACILRNIQKFGGKNQSFPYNSGLGIADSLYFDEIQDRPK